MFSLDVMINPTQRRPVGLTVFDMTEESYPIDVGHPPSALLRLINPLLGFLLRTPLAGPARKQLMVLSFTGRKTGRPYSIPVSAHVIDGDLYALAGAAWKQNFRDGAPAQVLNIELASPFGQAHFEVPIAEVSDFLQRTYRVVPEGREGEHVDLEAELTDLLRQA